MIGWKSLLGAASLAVGLLGSTSALANLLSNGSFEAPILTEANVCGGNLAFCKGYDPGVNDIPGWFTIGPGGPLPGAAVILLGNSYREIDAGNQQPLRFTAEDGSQSVDLTGEGNQGTSNGIKQTVATGIGMTYDLGFYVGNQYDRAPGYPNASAIRLFINGDPIAIFTNPFGDVVDDLNWKFFHYDFVADAPQTTIAFQNATPVGDNEAGLDNVTLTLIPEPSSFPLLALPLVGLGWLARRGAPAGQLRRIAWCNLHRKSRPTFA